jgi:2-dehydropantoate 2-reductase
LVRYIAQARGRVFPTTLGELEGPPGERLTQVAAAFEAAGLPVSLCAEMDAWLKTHAALMLPLALGIYAADGSVRRMARTRDVVLLTVRGIREGLTVLRALGNPILPARLGILSQVPEPLLVGLARGRLDTALAELTLETHTNAARDEMAQLAAELRGLRARAGVATPALDQLYVHIDPKVPALEEGGQRLPLDWEPLLRIAAPLVALLLGLGVARLRHCMQERRVTRRRRRV